jgi:ElaB/YqjD/DUF883 family membrane-anchored ribosome-binding protein
MAQMSNSTYGHSSSGREANDTLQDMKEKGMQQANRMVEKATDAVNDMADRVVEQGKEAAHQVQNAAGTVQSAVTKSLKEQPMTTLAAAAVVGFVLGALWKS